MSTSNSHLLEEIKIHQVAISELDKLSSVKGVYQKSCNLFFRTTIQKATVSEQKQLDALKAKLQRISSS